jgi:hypothetical protein
LHPDKTKVVYCKDGNRRDAYADTSFTFLGYTFRARAARDRSGNVFTAFLPAISKDALKKLSRTVRGWRIHRRTEASLAELARMINPVIRGWMGARGNRAPGPPDPEGRTAGHRPRRRGDSRGPTRLPAHDLALPFGARPEPTELSLRGTGYDYAGALLVGANPAPSPYSATFDT